MDEQNSESGAAEEQTPRTRAPRRSRRAGATASTRPPQQPLDVLAELGLAPEQEDDVEDAPTTGPETGSSVEDTDDVDDVDEEEDEEDEEDDEQEEPRLPAAALLFQAPDLSAARRRRPSQEERPEEDDEDVDDAWEQPDEDQRDEDDEQDGQDEDDGPDTGSGRRRRRRGGRGRRNRGGGGAPGSGEETEDDQPRAGEGQDGENRGGSRKKDGSGEGGSGKADGSERDSRGKDDNDNDADGKDQDPGGSDAPEEDGEDSEGQSSSRRRRRRRRSRGGSEGNGSAHDEVTALKGSTRLEAKRQRRREGREAGRRRPTLSESEFLARRESVARKMLVREQDGLNQIAVLEDGILVEHFVARHTQTSMVGNVYLGRVQNVLPSMEAAFVDLGKGRNAVLYAGEVNWDAAGMEGQPRRIEQALKSGDTVLVQVTKDPIGHKGARLTSQITLAGRHLVLVPSGGMTGISRKLPENERARLKKLLKEIVPEGAGVIVRTAAEGATEEQLRADIDRLTKQWADVEAKAKNTKAAPALLKGEPELAVRVVRDVFNEDFESLTVSGDTAWKTISTYVQDLSPDLADRMHHWTSEKDVFAEHRVDEQLAKAMDRKVFLPSGGSLIIERTEAMTVIDVNTGKFTGSGGTLEETVTKNNLEAAEEIVRQLRLRDIGGIIVIDFIDMVLESNRDLVLRRLLECLGRDRTRHQVAEVTSLGLVQMTRKRVGQGLVEAFSTPCEHCQGRGYVLHDHPVETSGRSGDGEGGGKGRRRRGKGSGGQPGAGTPAEAEPKDAAAREAVKATLATIAAAAASAHEGDGDKESAAEESAAEKSPAARPKRGGRKRASKPASAPALEGTPAERGEGTAEQDTPSASAAQAVTPASPDQAVAQAATEPPAQEPAAQEPAAPAEAEKPARKKRRRAVSTGVVTPGGEDGGIITLPSE